MSKNYKLETINQIVSKQSIVGVIGLGYVGLPLSLAFTECQFKVLGFDVDDGKVNAINSGISYIHHVKASIIQEARALGRLEATSDFSRISQCDAIILCLPTPLGAYREPDLSYIHATMASISPHIREGQIISLESTTYPGTTQEVVLPVVEKKGFRVGEDYFIVYSPEREDPGNDKYNTRSIPKVLGADTENCLAVGKALYESIICKIVMVSSTKAAEMTKLLENIHRAVNIGLMNELKPLTDKMGIDLYEVINAAASKPFGFVPYYPGPGLGGHCIPIDPFYLTWKAREYGMHTRFIELAGEINTSMPEYVVQKTADALNKSFKPVRQSKILILGISYKPNVDDLRESPALKILELLLEKGAKVDFSDPYFSEIPPTRKHDIQIKGVQLTPDTINMYDAVILATDHDAYDYNMIGKSAKLLVDTRGRYSTGNHIVRA